MAAFDLVKDLNDVALRPRLLRSLIREHVPDDKHPLGSPSQLSKVISIIKTHRLLSESSGAPTDQKLIDNWKSAVDSWLERLSQLVSDAMPDKCWAGICLLGVTIQECSSDRFLASYSVWFQKLLSHIQSAETSHFLKVASCATISDLLTRLGGFPNVKKDGTALAGKLIQPLLKLLNDDHSEAIWDGVLHLLCTIITSFPFSISRHYESAEAAIASKIWSDNCSFNMMKKLAHCLALLPKSKGDEESWSFMIQKILIWLNNHLNDAFQGFEEETRSHEAIRLLVPPGKHLPPLGGLALSGEPSSNSKRRSENLQTSSVSALMLCCCSMITSSYPVQVTVPVRALFALVERVLMMDASLPHSLRPFVTAMQQEYLSSELPVLHLYSLELLTAIIKGVRSQLLPHAASIVRLMSVYFKKCALPEMRIKVYTITKIMLISMGVGMASCLAQDVVDNAFVDLNPIGSETSGTSSNENPKPSTETIPQPNRRKRKHSTPTGSLEERHDGSSLEVGALKNPSRTLISLRIAALDALEALLTVGGALRSDGWRSNLDLLLINIVRNSLKWGWAGEEINIFQHSDSEPTKIWANMQLAALRALLASFLSSRVRSPCLAEGLELFRTGKQETGTKLAEFCAHALLALEVLIHPRALPVEDFPTANCNSNGVHRFPENLCAGRPNSITPFSSGTQGTGPNVLDSDHDDLCDSWLANGTETEATVTDCGETIKRIEMIPSETLTVCQDINLSDDGFDKEILEESKQNPEAANPDMEIEGVGDKIMAESHQLPGRMRQNQDSVPARGSTGAEIVLERITSDIGSSKESGNDLATDKDVPAAKTEGTSVGTSAASIPKKRENFTSEIADESDMEPFPDIVDADPDSD